MATQDSSNATESGSENKFRLDLIQENKELKEKIVDLEKMYALSEVVIKHLKSEWYKLEEESSALLEKETNTHIEYMKKTEKKISELESEKSALQKDKIFYHNRWNDTMKEYNELNTRMYQIRQDHIKEIEGAKRRAQNKEALMQIEMEQKNKELQDVVTKAQTFKFKDYLDDKTWIVLHEGGINSLVDVSQFEKFVHENSISMIDTQISHSGNGDYSINFQKNSEVTVTLDDTQISIDVKYDTVMQLFAWMKDKLNHSGDSDKKSKLTKLTKGNRLSHDFLLKMQQNEFESLVCRESDASNVVLCLQCNARMHLRCIPENRACPNCRYSLLSLDKDYAVLGDHPEMRPAILQKPLRLIEEPDLHERLKRLHNMPMHAQFACTCGHGHCMG